MTEKFRFREKGMYRLVNAVILTGAVLFGGAGFVGIGQMNAWLAAEAAILLILSAGLNFLPVLQHCRWLSTGFLLSRLPPD